MQQRTRNFIIGSLAAIALTATVTDLSVLEAISSNTSFSRVSPELRLGVELGIIDADELGGKSLSAPVSRRSFAVLLKKVLQMVGAPTGSELSDLRSSGIFNPAPSRRQVTRKTALEALARSTIYLANNGFITLDDTFHGNFTDYRIPEKYAQAISFLRSKGIVRGFPDGRFGISRALNKRDAVYLLYRFYEQIAASLMMKRDTQGLRFVDLPLDHPAMSSLKILEKAGAFDQMKFASSFDGYSSLNINEAVVMIESILLKHSCTTGAAEVKGLVAGGASSRPATRSDLTILLGHLVKALPAEISPNTKSYSYTDVEEGSKEAIALETLGNIGMFIGYPNGAFKGEELVTRFEAVGIIETVLTTLHVVVPDSGDQLAGKSDFEAFATMLKAKRARVQTILHRNDRPATDR